MRNDEIDELFDMWEQLGVICGGYCSKIDNDIISIMWLSIYDKDNRFTPKIAEKLNLDVSYVELIQYILCSTGMWEYGSSPRAFWPTDENIAKYFLEGCGLYYKRHWEEDEE